MKVENNIATIKTTLSEIDLAQIKKNPTKSNNRFVNVLIKNYFIKL